MRDHGCYERLGRTRDDAAGEAFDRSDACSGSAFRADPPSSAPRAGAAKPRLRLPRAWLKGSDDFSFSGLKTAVLHIVRAESGRATAPGTGDRVGVPVIGRRRADEEDGAGGAPRGRAQHPAVGESPPTAPLRETLIERSPLPVFAPPPVLRHRQRRHDRLPARTTASPISSPGGTSTRSQG